MNKWIVWKLWHKSNGFSDVNKWIVWKLWHKSNGFSDVNKSIVGKYGLNLMVLVM
jgi:hypothetical protein